MIELREYELKMLSALESLGGEAQAVDLTDATGLSNTTVMRAVLALQEKKMVHIIEKKQTLAKLTEEGKADAKEGLPERRIVGVLKRLSGKATIEEIVREIYLERRFISIALGWIQRKKWTTFEPQTKTLQLLGKQEEGNDERLLKLLSQEKGMTLVERLSRELQEAVQILKGRKLLETEEKIERTAVLTDAGRTTLKGKPKASVEITQLTPELIISGKWRKSKLQEYDLEAPVARNWLGRRHPYLHFLDEVKKKLVNLGFKEMTGTAVETSFFNFDALYTPQDHPAREIFDIYFVKSPKYGNVSADKITVRQVKSTHENGWKTGSTGWQYKYSTREARRLILRGHGTCLSARTLLSKDLEIPGRYFSIARCYRPEVLDKTHLTEFNQVEGIVVDKELTLRDLLGILKTFAIEIAEAEKVRLRPDYYPFTEPSVELSAYRKGYGWIEFGGSGIFRPEVTMPLGINVPVIAWGLGIDRLFMMRAGIDDIRHIFSQDLDWIRRKEVI